MGRRVRVEIDRNFERELLKSDFMRDLLEEPVQQAASMAKDLAPRDTGDLAESVYGDVALTAKGWVGRVGAEDYKAPWFEEGATGVAHRPFLRPAVESQIGPIEPARED